VRRLTDGEGEVGEKVQELTADSGVARTEEGRCRDGGSMEDRAGAARFQGGGSISVARVQEGDGKVARNFLLIDVVLVVSSVRVKRGRSVGMTVRPSGSSGQDCRRGILVV
jgi:hypothetical protein